MYSQPHPKSRGIYWHKTSFQSRLGLSVAGVAETNHVLETMFTISHSKFSK